MSSVSRLFLMCAVATSVPLVYITFVALAENGEYSSPHALSILCTSFLLPIAPALYTFPDEKSATGSYIVGVVIGFNITLEYWAGSSHNYTEVLASIGSQIRWDTFFFYGLLSVIVSALGAIIGWQLHYAIIALAKRVNKDFP